MQHLGPSIEGRRMPSAKRQQRQTSGTAPRLAAALVIVAGVAAVVTASTLPKGRAADEPYGAAQGGGKVITLRGDQGMEPVKLPAEPSSGPLTIDARRAVFTVANSRNPHPTAAQTCEEGSLPTNRYPLTIEDQARVTLVGGLFLSRVPQASEWRASYCNSAAISFRRAPDSRVDGVRIAGAWDAIRSASGSPGLKISNSWISNVKDDAVEDDYLHSVAIEDSLIDGAFQLLSVKPASSSKIGDSSANLVTLSGVVFRLSEYPYKGKQLFGALAKSEERSPRIAIRNSVLAVDYAGGRTYPHFWETSWEKIAGASNNLFLWLSDAPIPDAVPPPPAGFTVLRGQAARDAWNKARTNWINCHPNVARLPDDPKPNTADCISGTWGGF